MEAKCILHFKTMKATVIVILFFLLGLVYAARTSPTSDATVCSSAMSTKPRVDYWETFGRGHSIYDITVNNTGTQKLRKVFFDIDLSDNSTIITWWQFTRLSPTSIDLWDINPGGSAQTAGFITQYPIGVTPSVALAITRNICV